MRYAKHKECIYIHMYTLLITPLLVTENGVVNEVSGTNS